MDTPGGALGPALALTQQQLASIDGHAMAMNWMLISTPGGRRVVLHEGGTGGFSALVAFDPAAKRGAVPLHPHPRCWTRWLVSTSFRMACTSNSVAAGRRW